jgi:hypothetical protein
MSLKEADRDESSEGGRAKTEPRKVGRCGRWCVTAGRYCPRTCPVPSVDNFGKHYAGCALMRIIALVALLAGCGGPPFTLADSPATPSSNVQSASDSAVLEHDAGDVSDAGTHVPDAGAGECPVVGCLCESNSGSCSAALPYSCSEGAECCNWRPPGC